MLSAVRSSTRRPELSRDDSFTYTLTDGHGPRHHECHSHQCHDHQRYDTSATVHFTINSINDAPSAVDDNATTDEDLPSP